MDDILSAIIGLSIASILMFIFPLITMSDRADDISQLTTKIATTEFVDEIRSSGKITPERYGKFLENLGSTGNSYNIEIEARILDENPRRKEIQIEHTIGENAYYSIYTSQIENEFLSKDKDYYLKEGDIITISVKNTNQTMAQQLKNFFYTVIGNDTYIIAASHSGMVTATGI